MISCMVSDSGLGEHSARPGFKANVDPCWNFSKRKNPRRFGTKDQPWRGFCVKLEARREVHIYYIASQKDSVIYYIC